jgi:hypothetical protein
MNTKLNNITTQYRKFNANQALTEGQLNEFIDYFEDQDRLSRTMLSGVGIACGFKTMLATVNGRVLNEVDVNQQPLVFDYITIAQGAGVTTDGDLINLQDKIYGTKEVSIGQTSEIGDYKFYKYYRTFVDKAGYPHFVKNNVQMPLLELLKQDEYDMLISKGASAADFKDVNTINDFSDKIAILYLESYSNDESPCEDADCENNGAEQVADLKVLLAKRSDIDAYIVNDKIYDLHNDYEELYNRIKDIEVPRVILNAGITTEQALRLKFQSAIQTPQIITDLSKDFEDIAKTFGVNTGLGGPTIFSKLTQLLDTSYDDNYQYRYDLLKDLVDTYNEIRGLILHLKSVCCPGIASFPKHLMLGNVGASLNLGEYTPYRHGFYNSPITTDADENKEKLLLLANRFVQKIKDFQPFNGPIKITPSNIGVALAEKAIPFYYNVNQSLLQKWNFNKTQAGKETYNLSYHTGSLSTTDFVQNPLLYNIDDFDFYRIEGHLRIPYKTALENINDLKSKFGLAFDVVPLVLKKGKISSPVANPTAVLETSAISIKDLRSKLVSISKDVSNKAIDTRATLQNISVLDKQLQLLNQVELAQSVSGVSLIKQNTRKDDIVAELLSEFLDRNSGLEHFSGVPKGGTFYLIYESEDNNEVIADFATPYLCCSKKDPVFLVMPATKLCQNDAKIPITILPLDGEVKAYSGSTEITGVTLSGGQNFFNPALVSSQYFGQTITFTVNDDPVDTQMVVYAQPNVTVVAGEAIYGDDADIPDATVVFSVNGTITGLKYVMNFGDGKSAQGEVPAGGKISHTYSLVAGQEDIFSPTIAITNLNGCSKQYNLQPLKLIGQSTVACLNGMRVIVQYKEGVSPSHNCNNANFNLLGNDIVIEGLTPKANPNALGNVFLSNTKGTNDQLNYPPGVTSGASRYTEIIITQEEAEVIAARSADGFISFALDCALPPTTSYPTGCHPGVAWTQIYLPDNPVPIYDGYPANNFLQINPCTGEVR